MKKTIVLSLLALLGCQTQSTNSPNQQSEVEFQSQPCIDDAKKLPEEYLSSEEIRFLNLINIYRTQNGLQRLMPSECLTRPARWLSHDMGKKNYFSHDDSLGRKWSQRMLDFGITRASAENIGAGQPTADRIFLAWKNSHGHNKNMLSPNSKSIGIAVERSLNSKFAYYWTIDLSR
ncbi:MAG: CAP domain-containing protein [Bdellovibrionales bacterium]